jgi:hypothetical protein
MTSQFFARAPLMTSRVESVVFQNQVQTINHCYWCGGSGWPDNQSSPVQIPRSQVASRLDVWGVAHQCKIKGHSFRAKQQLGGPMVGVFDTRWTNQCLPTRSG